MTWNDFFEKVRAMRQLQKEYDRTCDPARRRTAKRVEAEVDAMIRLHDEHAKDAAQPKLL